MEQEGVIKFRLEYTLSDLKDFEIFDQLNSWRNIMHRLKLINREAFRYCGLGYGNISGKLQTNPSPTEKNANIPFLISGTQTGHLPQLTKNHYTLISKADTRANLIIAEGPVKPSSEALTHAAVYGADPSIRWVIHVHAPEIWKNTVALGIPRIDKKTKYGTPEMANAVNELLKTPSTREKGIFAMQGHQDGIVGFGSTAERAGMTLIRYLALALETKAISEEAVRE